MPAPPIAALRGLLNPAPAAVPRPEVECELCSQPLGEAHEHLLDLNRRHLACACTGCALLFDGGDRTRPHPARPAGAMPAWTRLPRDSRYLPSLDLSGEEWASLSIPIRLAFLSVDGRAGAVTAAYPSPAGVVTAAIEPTAWAALTAVHPELRRMASDVEALLLNRLETPHQSFIVPLDQGYRLAGLIRAHWSGFSGGPELRRALARFSAELRIQSRVEAAVA